MNDKPTVEDIKKIREMTGVSLIDAKRALEEHGGFEAALEAMKAKGLAKMVKRESRLTEAGVIHSYVHDGRIGVLVEVNCETDFVAKNEHFLQFVRDLALQVAAYDPDCFKPQEVGAGEEARSLLGQDFIKDPGLTVAEALRSLIAKLGENIVVVRFVRFELGDSQAKLVSNVGKS